MKNEFKLHSVNEAAPIVQADARFNAPTKSQKKHSPPLLSASKEKYGPIDIASDTEREYTPRSISGGPVLDAIKKKKNPGFQAAELTENQQ